MKICFSNQMKRLDESSIKDYGIPGIVLMENAGLAVAEEIEKLGLPQKNAAIVCGTGNNGGDGFVIARQLCNRGWRVNILLCGEAEKLNGDALCNYKIARNMDISIELINEGSLSVLEYSLKDNTLIVDALLGTGISGVVKYLHRAVINRINDSKACVVSVDIPSGLDPDSGFFCGECVRADYTVTFQLPKAGLVMNNGPEACGELIVKDISIPKAAISKMELQLNLLDQTAIKELLPIRSLNTHKGSYGKVFTVACSKGMEGSGLMSARAALRSGAGIVLLGIPGSLQRPLQYAMEIMTAGLADMDTGILAEECTERLLEHAGRSSVLLIGPGLTAGQSIKGIMSKVIQECTVPMIIDADGLNAISEKPDILKGHRNEIAITPHPGEMARLCDCSSQDIQRDRLGYARRFAEEYNVVVVLKGFRTVIARPDGTVFINPTGNPGMATAGSGDVLAGIIAGIAAQKPGLWSASLCGTYIHGAAGDLAARQIGEFGLTAGDIIDNIPHTIKSIAGR